MKNQHGTTTGNTDAGGAMREVLGAAVIDVWGELPQAVQEVLFERAVAHGHGDTLRHALARFLHDHHPRTANHAGT